MLTVITPSGDHVEHERDRDVRGRPVNRCRECQSAWPCSWVIGAQDAADELIKKRGMV